MAKISVNGRLRTVDVDHADTPLLWVIRENLGMTGTKFGCGESLCGACTVHINGEAVRSCQTPIGDVKESDRITTIEGLDAKGQHPLAKGLDRRAGAPVRLLPVRPDHAGRGPAGDRTRSRRTTRSSSI